MMVITRPGARSCRSQAHQKEMDDEKADTEKRLEEEKAKHTAEEPKMKEKEQMEE